MAEASKSSSDSQPDLLLEEETPFRHYVPGERPRADAAFFELLLLRVVSHPAPLADFDNVWPRAMQTLAGLNIFRLANLSGEEIATATTLIGGELGTRLSDKTDSLAAWAEAFWRIRQIYGSFRQYLRSFDNDGFDALLDDLKQRLPGLTPEFLAAYLREVGEKTPVAPPRTAQPAGRKATPPAATAPPPRPVADRPAQGTDDKGRRRRRGRGSAPKQQTPATSAAVAAAPTPEPKPAQAQPAEKSAGRNRRNRRRFFRRKRGRDGSAPSEAKGPSTPSAG